MKRKVLAVATAATIASALMNAPADAHGWHRGGYGWGPAVGLGLLAGALAAGAYGPYGPYGYGYYGPAYYGYGPAYYAGPYRYYPVPRFYRRHYYYRYW